MKVWQIIKHITKKKNKPTKKKRQYKIFLHAQKRAKSRYGLLLSKNEYKKLCKTVSSLEDVKRQSNRVSIRYLNYKDYNIPIVWDKIRRLIITFLPEKIT